MLKAENIKKLEKLLAGRNKKALATRPEIFVIEKGFYKIPDSKSVGVYILRLGQIPDFSEKGNGVFLSCTCPAGLTDKACYHGASVFYFHLELCKFLRLNPDKNFRDFCKAQGAKFNAESV